MAQFTINTPITTPGPTIDVDGVALGTHRYQLVVEDDSGNQSQAAVAVVTVAPPTFVVPVGPSPVALDHDPAANEVWVVNSGAPPTPGSVSVVSIATRAEIARIRVGTAPAEIALTPAAATAAERKLALVTNPGENNVSVIDMRTHTLVSTIQVGLRPLGVDISPDGRFGYVVNSTGAAAPFGTLSVIDMNSLTVVRSLGLGLNPTRVQFSATGKEAYVNNSGDGTVSVIAVPAHQLSAVVKVGGAQTSSPRQVVTAAQGFPVWTVNPGTKTASTIDANHAAQDFDARIAAECIAAASAGRPVFCVGPNDPALAVLDGTTAPARMIRIPGNGGSTASLAVVPGDRVLLAASTAQNLLSLVDIRTLALLVSVPTPQGPVRVIATADGKFGCVTCQAGNALIVLVL